MRFPARHIFAMVGLVLFSVSLAAQVTIERYVIGSLGHYSVAGSIAVSGTVGETMVQSWSFSDILLTQGFQQPRVLSELPLEVSIEGNNATCLNSFDGNAVVAVANGDGPYTFDWNDGQNSTDTAINLGPGLYSVIVTDQIGRTGAAMVSIDADLMENCGLHIYTGLTPNSDTYNDWWIIDNIEDFPNNSVEIFNRWGDRVWETSSYNNHDNRWEGKTQDGMDLPDGTYFYVFQIEGDVFKGWVQITR